MPNVSALPEPSDSRVPPGLSTSGGALWQDVTGRYDLDAETLSTLLDACRLRDRLDRLAEALSDVPVLVESSQGVKPHPLFAEIRAQELAYARLVASLRLPDEEGTQPQRRGGARTPYLYPKAAKGRR